jgi:CubicO group peptidase (beta-lactamase class C family)
MKHKASTLLFFTGLTLLAKFTIAQQLSASDSIDLFLKNKMQQRHIPALQIAVVRGGKIVKNTTFGTAKPGI